MRPRHVAVIFVGSLALLLAPVVWISATVMRLDRAEAAARRQAAQEETVRLALWRMDSALIPIIAEERGRAFSVYRSFYRADNAQLLLSNSLEPGEVMIASPLLTLDSTPFVLLHFQIDPGGKVTSPQVPGVEMRQSALDAGDTAEQLDLAATRLHALVGKISSGALASLPPPAERPASTTLTTPPSQPNPPQVAQQLEEAQSPKQQQARNLNEYNARSQTYQTMQPSGQVAAGQGGGARTDEVRAGAFEARWIDHELVLARRVATARGEYFQGAWLDWEKLRPWLLGSVADLLMGAELRETDGAAADTGERRLAGLPVKLLVPAAIGGDESLPPQVRWPLIVAWACVALAALAVGVLLLGTVLLSERRAAFVSAVTHELRTPLTTFRLYTDMLASDRLRDEEKRAGYVDTLRREALRLSHLVENVLAYARLERRRGQTRLEALRIGGFLERIAPRLRDRTAQVNMDLHVDAGDTANVEIRADAAALEQVLFNLVDNACKYGTSERSRVELSVQSDGRCVALRVRDFGRGLDAGNSQKFRPFHRSAADAAGGPAGVGLGLALSGRLARAMGGRLKYERAKPGACFVVTLPRA